MGIRKNDAPANKPAQTKSGGRPGTLKKNASFSLKSNKSTSGSNGLRGVTAQKVRNYSDYIKYFCGLADGRVVIAEAERLILQPVYVDESVQVRAVPYMAILESLLRSAQVDPQDWFDFAVRKKMPLTPGGASPTATEVQALDVAEFRAEISKICNDLGHPLMAEEDVDVLFNFICGEREDQRFEAFDLALAFAKYRLSPTKLSNINVVAEQLRTLGSFMRDIQTNLIDVGGLSPNSIRSGVMTYSELQAVLSNLHSRFQMTEAEASVNGDGGDAGSQGDFSLFTHKNETGSQDGRSLKSAPLRAEDDKEGPFTPNSAKVKVLGQVEAEKSSSPDEKSGSSKDDTTHQNSFKSPAEVQPQGRRTSFLATVTENIRSALTSTKITSGSTKRSSFLNLRSSLVVPATAPSIAGSKEDAVVNTIITAQEREKPTPSSPPSPCRESRSTLRDSVLNAINLRQQLVSFLQLEEKENLAALSHGKIKIDKRRESTDGGIKGLFFASNPNSSKGNSKKEKDKPVEDVGENGQIKRRRYSSLLLTSDKHHFNDKNPHDESGVMQQIKALSQQNMLSNQYEANDDDLDDIAGYDFHVQTDHANTIDKSHSAHIHDEGTYDDLENDMVTPPPGANSRARSIHGGLSSSKLDRAGSFHSRGSYKRIVDSFNVRLGAVKRVSMQNR